MLKTDNLDFLLDKSTGDIDISGGTLNFARGLQGVAQLARIRVNMIRGEWFADTSYGLPLLANRFVTTREAILGQKFDKQKVTKAYYDMLITTPAVTDVLLLECSFDSKLRKVKIKWQLRTVFGDTIVEELVK